MADVGDATPGVAQKVAIAVVPRQIIARAYEIVREPPFSDGFT